MKLKEELQNFLHGKVADDQDILKRYSRDASLFEIEPRVVVFPQDAQDLSRLVVFVRQHEKESLSLVCRSGGTDMTGGPLGKSIIVDMTKEFHHIKEVGENFAVTEPGVFYRDFEKETFRHNLFLPCYPASKEMCTVGGMVANNAGGEKSLRYGKTEDYVQELKVVLSDGNEYRFSCLRAEELDHKLLTSGFEGDLYKSMYKLIREQSEILERAKPKVSKNSAGYNLWNVWNGQTFDLTKLFTGSQGTLGVITEIKFRLIRPKKHSVLLIIFLKKLEPLVQIIETVLRHNPESFESYDDHTLRLALRFLPDFLKLLKAKNIVSLAFQFLPEFGMLVSGGLPKLILLAEFTGDSEEEAQGKARGANEDLQKFRAQTKITRNAKEVQKYLAMRRESFNLLRHHIRGMRTAPFIDDIIVKPEKLSEFLPQLEKILAEYPRLIYTIAGHMGNGNFHIIPLMNLADPENRRMIPELSRKVYDLVFRFEGSMTAEHNDGLIRTPFLQDMYGEKVYELFRQVKRIFDPSNIFNPGKKVDGNLEYAIGHIAIN